MKEPLIKVKDLLSRQNSADATRADGNWSTLSLEHGQQAGAQGLMKIVQQLQEHKDVHFFTDGSWSLHQLLTALLEITGPAAMYTSTYAMSETSVRCIAGLKDSGLITRLSCVIDDRVETRSAGSFQLLQSIADECRLARCHAKATVLEGAQHSLVIIGSANYTENKRLEIGFVTRNKIASAFHKGWITNKSLSNGRSA